MAASRVMSTAKAAAVAYANDGNRGPILEDLRAQLEAQKASADEEIDPEEVGYWDGRSSGLATAIFFLPADNDERRTLDDWRALMEAAAFPQPSVTGDAKLRAKKEARNEQIDEANKKDAETWIQKRVREAQARTKALGAQGGLKTGKLKTGKLTTGHLTTGDLLNRVSSNYRRQKRKKKVR